MIKEIILYLYFLSGILIIFSGFEIFASLIIYTFGISFIFVYWSKRIDQFLYKKRLSLGENLEISIKKFYLNRGYLRLKSFWMNDFRKNYKKVKIRDLIWQIPYILSISFYTVLLTRFRPALIVFFLRCWVQILLLDNPMGYLYLVLYFIPLIILTFLAALPPVTKKLIELYGVNTMKKLGFNIYTTSALNNAKIVAKSGLILAAGDAAAGIINEEVSWRYKDYPYNRDEKVGHLATRKYEDVLGQDRNTAMTKPVYPDRGEYMKRKVFATWAEILKSIQDLFSFPPKKK